MEVTVDGMDAVVEPIGTYSRRVTGMKVLNHYLQLLKSQKVQVVIENKSAHIGRFLAVR